jgi:hypothetical protein
MADRAGITASAPALGVGMSGDEEKRGALLDQRNQPSRFTLLDYDLLRRV